MAFNIISLNCNSLYARLAEVKLLLYSLKPTMVCLTETWVREAYLPSFLGYNALWCNRDGRGGGLCFLIRSSACYRALPLVHFAAGFLEVQAVEVRMSNGNCISVLNVYNPSASVTVEEFVHYIDQLNSPYVLAGDFNAHSPLLSSSCVRADITGRSLEALLISTPSSLLNPVDFVTYIDRRTGRGGSLDLFILSSEVLPYFSLTRLRDVGSDHYPIMAESTLPVHELSSIPVPRWKITTAGLGDLSRKLAPSSLVFPASVQDVGDDVTSRLIDAATASVPQSSGRHPKRKVSPWWTVECKEAVSRRCRARRQLLNNPTRERLIEFKRRSAEARNCIIKHKRAYKREFLSSITFTTPLGVAWKKVKFMRSFSSFPTYPLVNNDHLLTSTLDKANLFCETYQAQGRSGEIRAPWDLHRVIVDSWTGEALYNLCFTENELVQAIRRLRMTSPGHDRIHNGFFRALTEDQYGSLLMLFNQSFQLGIVPDAWKKGIVLPILKPGKDPSLAASYRPITLLSCLGKLMERLVAARLEYTVEKESLLSPGQCGFRKGLCTLDVLVRLESRIRQAQSTASVCLVVYVDLKSAFDKVWIDGLLYKLARAGICGALARWLNAYLSERIASVRVNGIISDPLRLQAGVPQGAVLSPMLFNLMLMDVPQMEGVDVLLYADDVSICCGGHTMGEARVLMQRYLDRFHSYCTTWGMVVNELKTVFQYFTRKRVHLPILRFNNRVLHYERQHRLLGLIFDSPRLIWGPHISYLRINIFRRMDILKHIASPTWGANRRFLRSFYCAYIRAKLDYGSVLYRAASHSQLSKLDVLQNACLRLVLGARRTTPVVSLQAEANVPPLSLRRDYLCARFALCVLHRVPGDGTAALLHGAPSLFCLSDWAALLRSVDFPFGVCREEVQRDLVPPWVSLDAFVSLDFSAGPDSVPSVLFDHLLDTQYSGFLAVYCDGSKINDPVSTSSGIYVPSQTQAVAWRLSPFHSVLAAELFAIFQALLLVEQSEASKWVICSDSCVALQMVLHPTDTCFLLVSRIRRLLLALNKDREVHLQWVKAHVGIAGNERADAVAKLGHGLDHTVLLRPHLSDILCVLRVSFFRYWESLWIHELQVTGKGSHLASLRSGLLPVPWVSGHSRRLSVVLARLRLGHVGVGSYLYRFGMADSPMCMTCRVDDTIEHFLLSCSRFCRERQRLLVALQTLGVYPVNVKVLLGGADYSNRLQHLIIRHTAQYLTATGCLSVL